MTEPIARPREGFVTSLVGVGLTTWSVVLPLVLVGYVLAAVVLALFFVESAPAGWKEDDAQAALLLAGGGVVVGAVFAAIAFASGLVRAPADPSVSRFQVSFVRSGAAWFLVLVAAGLVVATDDRTASAVGVLGVLLWFVPTGLLFAFWLTWRVARVGWESARTNAFARGALLALGVVVTGFDLLFDHALDEAQQAALVEPPSNRLVDALESFVASLERSAAASPGFALASAREPRRFGSAAGGASGGGDFAAFGGGGGDDGARCLEQLKGPACNDVWGRARRSLVSNGYDDADELLHESFIAVCLVPPRTEPERLCGRFWTAVVNDANDQLRVIRRRPSCELDPGLTCARPRPDEIVIDAETQRAIQKALQCGTLTRDESRAIELHVVRSLTYDVVAARMDVSVSTAKRLVKSGLDKLREALACGWDD